MGSIALYYVHFSVIKAEIQISITDWLLHIVAKHYHKDLWSLRHLIRVMRRHLPDQQIFIKVFGNHNVFTNWHLLERKIADRNLTIVYEVILKRNNVYKNSIEISFYYIIYNIVVYKYYWTIFGAICWLSETTTTFIVVLCILQDCYIFILLARKNNPYHCQEELVIACW